MKVLILDDERWRHDTFDAIFKGADVHHAYSVKQFKKALAGSTVFDLVCFDHDLGTSKTGLDAACWFVAVHPPCRCVVHSWNHYGADSIQAELESSGFDVRSVPFTRHLNAALEGWLP